MPNPLLTIAIPTYKRAKFLNICLDSITKQIDANDERIELLVSNNCSPDNTTEIVQKYITQGFKINYIINNENIGADANIAQCFKEANGQFVVAFGDDDTFKENAINFILEVIEKNYTCGFLYINNRNLHKIKNEEIKLIELLQNKNEVIKRIALDITFISGNFVNKNYINFNNILIDKSTNLNQVHIYLDAIIHSNESIIINKQFINIEDSAADANYNVFNVFCININKVFNKYKSLILNYKQISIFINNTLLIEMFSQQIILRKQHTQFKIKEPYFNYKILLYYKTYFLCWFLIFPIIVLPKPLAKWYIRKREIIIHIYCILKKQKNIYV